jgi:DNA-binding transcriptional MerR regulator
MNIHTKYSITALAKEFDITPRAIRFYEDKGLLSPVRDGQRRIFLPRDRTRLRLIMRGKRLGFSLEEIREILDLYETPKGETGQLQHLLDKIQDRRATLLAQQNDLQDALNELQHLENQCQTLLHQQDAS